ncbi:MAG TPA: hypothetical protein VFT12_00920 [Thermoanaerobaculia bacterium]|nr:hypothetical protein [Thermoanaerobaculia bacterium]
MPRNDLDVMLEDLKRQREELDQRIRNLETQRDGTSDILERLQRWRTRAEETRQISEDETLRLRR